MNLVIVESPTKARTIGRMLGPEYRILASMGHVRDLPEHSLGVDIENDFAPEYVDTPRSAKTVREIKSAAKDADCIYLAPDPDREGEAIAWHLRELFGKNCKKDFRRVTFHEITRSAIENAFAHAGVINQDLVDAQQARRVLDRLVGYKVSPLLWSKLAKGISAGRVQSVAVLLVVERERAINAFVPQEYWNLSAEFSSPAGGYQAKLFKINGQDFQIKDAAEADAAEAALRGGMPPEAAGCVNSERKRYAPPPFTTSTLQQSANTVLHYSASSTMNYAQKLYEGIDIGSGGTAGLITYMRTDSVAIAAEAQRAAAAFIGRTYGSDYVPAKPNFYRSKGSAQEAHEAIRPTDVNRTPELMAPYLDGPMLKLYTLIWQRFVASQMTPCVQKLATLDTVIRGADERTYTFRTTAATVVFPGFTRVFPEDAKKNAAEDAAVIGRISAGTQVGLEELGKEQKFTEPPPRYTEAGLIKELEENGIGRPSTYATILKTILSRKYVEKDRSKLIPTKLGIDVTDFLVGHLPELINVKFTAGMESKLDDVEEGKLGWTKMLHEFYEPFQLWLTRAKEHDLPEQSGASAVVKLLENVQFEPKAKGAPARSFDDGKFYNSVRKQAESGKAVSARQLQTLLALAGKYASQIDLSALPSELRSQAESAAAAADERREQRAAAAASGTDEKYRRLFEAFDKVTWQEPEKRGRRVYDDRKFFESLRSQLLGGRTLSERQSAALGALARKYAGELSCDASLLDELFGGGSAETVSGGENAASSGDGASGNASMAEADAMLKKLSAVKNWAEPVKRGRFTYDDREFYASLAKQRKAGRVLSPRQLAALKKLSDKYSAGENV